MLETKQLTCFVPCCSPNKPADGLDLMYQPVRCAASDVVRRADKLHFAAVCWTKGLYQARHSIGITIRGGDAISFNENDFDKDYFSISGNYVRCNRYYRCEKKYRGLSISSARK
jgi:hypothetical protein